MASFRWLLDSRRTLAIPVNVCTFDTTSRSFDHCRSSRNPFPAGGGTMTAAHRIGRAAHKGPSVVKELVMGFTLALMAGGLWKMHHWNYQRRTKQFYDMLEKEEISIVVEE